MWIVLHYIAANLYPIYCAEPTLLGFLQSPFATPTPHCQGLRFIISNGGQFINNMWISLGTYACSKMCGSILFQESDGDKCTVNPNPDKRE